MADNTAQLPLTNELKQVLALLATDPAKAADAIDALATRLHNHAADIREKLKQDDDFKVEGGMTDRVKMSVRGPNGTEKQYIDTGRR